jgi:hypothetical protein
MPLISSIPPRRLVRQGKFLDLMLERRSKSGKGVGLPLKGSHLLVIVEGGYLLELGLGQVQAAGCLALAGLGVDASSVAWRAARLSCSRAVCSSTYRLAFAWLSFRASNFTRRSRELE